MDNLSDSLSLEWIRIDVGYLDKEGLQGLIRFVAKYSPSSPAFIALVGSLSSRTMLVDSPEIQAILDNTLPCQVLAKASDDLDYVPPSAVSVYHRLGTDVYYLRVHGKTVDAIQNPDKQTFSTDQDPPDEIELDLAERDSEFSRLLLFIFAMSHAVIKQLKEHLVVIQWFQPDGLFSNYDLRMLKIVDLARLRAQKYITKVVDNVTEFKDWIGEGSICCPRLVFVFSGMPRGIGNDPSSVLKVEQDMAVRLYTVLKKCRLISIPRSSGLCFLSARKETVIFAKEIHHSGTYDHLFPHTKELDAKLEKSDFFLPTTPEDHINSVVNRTMPVGVEQHSAPSSLSRMLKTCAQEILQTASMPNSMRPPGFPWPSHFYRPTLAEWFSAALQFHSLLFHGEEFRSLLDSKLGCTMSISRKYSRSVAAFTASNFALRTQESCVRQVRNCLHSYVQFARGPALKGYGAALTRYLAEHGQSRRQCSAQSLYGSRCIKPLHWTPAQQAKLGNGRRTRLPVIFHQSRGTLMGFCSCGRSAHQRAEPFNIREANELFYEMTDFKCCNLLENRIDIPSVTVSRREKKPKEEKKPEMVTVKRYEDFPDLHTAAQMNEREISQPFISVAVEPVLTEVSLPKVSPLMFQVGMSYDVEPKISSWVLYGLGPATRYRHSYGLEHHLQADFLNGYHHMLPVDAEIMLTHSHRLTKHLPNRPVQHYTVEARPWHSLLYFGLDYECPKGHRFMYRSKEIYEMTSNGREEAAQTVVEDILLHGAPLFARCPCKNSDDNRQFIAQLMRIHVIAPKDPMRLGLFPRVKTGRGVPAFTPGISQPTQLAGGTYWVMRLPFSYYDSIRRKGPFCAPRVSYPKHRKLPCPGFRIFVQPKYPVVIGLLVQISFQRFFFQYAMTDPVENTNDFQTAACTNAATHSTGVAAETKQAADAGRTNTIPATCTDDPDNWGIEIDPDARFHPMMHRED